VCSLLLCPTSPLITKDEIQAVDLAGLGFRLLDCMVLPYADAANMLQL
jgi:hypothetical protein